MQDSRPPSPHRGVLPGSLPRSPRPPSPFPPPIPPDPTSSPRPPSPPPIPPVSPPPPDFDQNNSDRDSGRDTPSEDNYPDASLPKIRTAIEFIELIKTASLASQFDPDELAEFLDPREHESEPPDDPGLKLSLLNFISFMGHSQTAYNDACQNVRQCFPDIEILSYYQVERRAQNFSGVITWEHHMCVRSCIGFTGPYANLEQCPRCGELRYKEKDLEESDGERKVPRQVFTTFPVGPQLQAHWKHPQTAKDMHYRWEKTQELLQERSLSGESPDTSDDIFCGEDYIRLVEEGVVGEYDSVLMLSMDGAQLYESKQSDCWIYIWILADLCPDKRYKVRNILPGGVIPGPEPPGDLDSFLFPGLAHLSALQREGLRIWDSYHRRLEIAWLFLFLVLADAVAMAYLSGSVGHHGRKGCRLLCGLIGRNKLQGAHYYPALLRPVGFETHRTSSHPDIDINNLPVPDPIEYRRDLFHVIGSRTNAEFRNRRFNTGIAKPSIFDGLSRILPLPTCFPGDLMHQPLINLAALLLDLWCSRPAARDHDRHSVWPWAVLVGDVWKTHGEAVGHAAKYLPSSFGRPPRNPQEKVSSGYKAHEFLYYIYGEGPGLFYGILPEPYYSHFCLLVRAIRIIHQHKISKEQITKAHQFLLRWVVDFEVIYCDRNPDRLHFIRQCVHSLTHLAMETHRVGPLCLSSQWTMERIIGYLGSLLRQPSNAFRNLAMQTRRVANTNSLVAMWPELQNSKDDPRGSKNLGDGYLLLGPRDTSPHNTSAAEYDAMESFFAIYPGADYHDRSTIYRWARLKLPVEQVARSRLKEVERCPDMARTDRNVKVRYLIKSTHFTISYKQYRFYTTKPFTSEKYNSSSLNRLATNYGHSRSCLSITLPLNISFDAPTTRWLPVGMPVAMHLELLRRSRSSRSLRWFLFLS